MNGILSVIKPTGISSHDVVSWARRVYQTKKVGHAGTLDPGAAGILVLAMGKATRLIPYIQSKYKTYRAELALGYTTDSLDLFSEITEHKSVPDLSDSEWVSVLKSFEGKSKQIPPMTSAIKVNGKALYKLAREGKTVEREPRDIIIYSCDFISYDKENKKLLFDVTCSAGTYIRTLCGDIAKKVGTVGCMSFLLRTKVGNFSLENSFIMTKNKQELLPMSTAVVEWIKVACNDKELEELKTGKVIDINVETDNQHIAFYNNSGDLVALGKRVSDKRYHPFRVFI